VRYQAALIAFALAAAPRSFAATWDPIDKGELAQTAPTVDKSAGAEVLLWDVRVYDDVGAAGDLESVREHHVRIKIFDEQGARDLAQVEIPLGNLVDVAGIEARTVRPDGTVLELKKGDVFERTALKAGNTKVLVKTFALPGVEPGVVIEYRWREEHRHRLTHYVELPLQREIPVRTLRYSVKPSAYVHGLRMVVSSFHTAVDPQQTEANGFTILTLHDVPAFKAEPDMPPEAEVRGFLLVYYKAHATQAREDFWRDQGRELHDTYKKKLTPVASVRAEALKLTTGATSPEEKLERLSLFCRNEIKHFYFDDNLTTEERQRAMEKPNDGPADTLARKLGTLHDVKVLFGALAVAAGFDARIAASVDRDRIFFDEGFLDPYFMDQRIIVVRVGDDWRFYNPAASDLPTGMLPWAHEGLRVLVADPRQPFFLTTPVAAPDRSTRRRSARLRLDAEGGLEGDVRIEAIGHAARRERGRYASLSPEKRIDELTDAVKSRLPAAEISGVAFEGLDFTDHPFRLSYHLKVPHYAQHTGARLFVEPAFFEKGRPPRFTAADRRHPIYFPFAWTDEDDVRIEIPSGLQIENGEGTPPISAAPVGGYTAKLGIENATHTLVHNRRIWFGGDGHLLFESRQYGPIKGFFDAVQKADARTIVLKQVAP
jgi:hypothetical protein